LSLPESEKKLRLSMALVASAASQGANRSQQEAKKPRRSPGKVALVVSAAPGRAKRSQQEAKKPRRSPEEAPERAALVYECHL
jgi:hypothetical protein